MFSNVHQLNYDWPLQIPTVESGSRLRYKSLGTMRGISFDY